MLASFCLLPLPHHCYPCLPANPCLTYSTRQADSAEAVANRQTTPSTHIHTSTIIHHEVYTRPKTHTHKSILREGYTSCTLLEKYTHICRYSYARRTGTSMQAHPVARGMQTQAVILSNSSGGTPGRGAGGGRSACPSARLPAPVASQPVSTVSKDGSSRGWR